ncbi:MAG: CZB domain-containing protein [Betaproteobacteria bacterium]|nr:CZB domain-containing protein [Betaproteobacteria bacterium]
MDWKQAIAQHMQWKDEFCAAFSRQEPLDADTIAQDNCCELGKWLHGEAKAKLQRFVSYSECISEHAAFHAEAAKVARAINSKQYAEAEAMLCAGARYATASASVAAAIVHLGQEADLP